MHVKKLRLREVKKLERDSKMNKAQKQTHEAHRN